MNLIKYQVIDMETGFPIVATYIGEGFEVPEDCVKSWDDSELFYSPKYDFELNIWVETMSKEEHDKMSISPPAQISPLDQLRADVDYILMLNGEL